MRQEINLASELDEVSSSKARASLAKTLSPSYRTWGMRQRINSLDDENEIALHEIHIQEIV